MPPEPSLPPDAFVDANRIVANCPECGQKHSARPDQISNIANCVNCGIEFAIADSSRPLAEAPVDPDEHWDTEEVPQSHTAYAQGQTQTMCRNHPNVPAESQCRSCKKSMCQTCAFPQVDGTALCSGCAVIAKRPVSSGSIRMRPRMPIPEDAKCPQHPGNLAVNRCTVCKSYVCETCDFVFPGNVHVCPDCVNKQNSGLSETRKKCVVWAYICAGLATVSSFGLIIAAGFMELESEESETVLGMLFMLFGMVPAAAGLICSLTAIDKRLKNPASVRVALVWNILVVVGFLGLMVLGSVAG